MKPLVVRHAAGRCAVIVRRGALGDLAAVLAERHPEARPAIIADENVAAALGSPLPAAPLFTFPAGELHKTRATWADLTDRLLAARFDRHTVIIAMGGGVTTDLAGFVAATLMRGVPWIAVPTTTLAMLDAAIGGKTGVDTTAGKNLVGAFHPPTVVLSDPDVLASLPERTFREGLAEAVKHAVTLDEGYGAWISANAPAIARREGAALESLIRRSVELKGEVVAEDEREGDRRAVLNAGHTIAHALEQASDYAIPHGEAVAIGLVIETRVAETMGVARPGTADQIAALLTTIGLPTAPPPLNHQLLLNAMHGDKKNRGGVVHAALIASIGTMARQGEGWTMPLDLGVLDRFL